LLIANFERVVRKAARTATATTRPAEVAACVVKERRAATATHTATSRAVAASTGTLATTGHRAVAAIQLAAVPATNGARTQEKEIAIPRVYIALPRRNCVESPASEANAIDTNAATRGEDAMPTAVPTIVPSVTRRRILMVVLS
jgi:hypothetical protein